MTVKTHTYILILLLIVIAACEEVIHIDLNEDKPEIVIEAVICEDSTLSTRITKSTSYFETGLPEMITDAVVSLSDNKGDSEILPYQGNGYYRGSVIRGNENTSYNIKIDYNGISYTSQSYMPPATEILSLESKMNAHGGPGLETIYELECRFTERPGLPDYYLIRFIHNDELIDGYYSLASDFNSDNGVISFSPGMYFFEAGDSVEIIIFSVDKNVYSYFMQLNDAMRGMNMFSTPYNPRTNIDNAILGYFAAWSFVSAEIIIE